MIAPPLEGYAKYPAGSAVRDILSDRTGTVAEKPAGEFGDIVFVTDAESGKTYPMRSDQLEMMAPVMPMAAPAMQGAEPIIPPAGGPEGLPPVAEPGALPPPVDAGVEGDEPVKAGLKAGGKKFGGGDGDTLNWEETSAGLVFTVGGKYQEELKEAVEAGTGMRAFDDIIDALQSNGDLESIQPEEIGALTSAPIVGRVERDDQGNILKVDEVYWFPDYQIKDPVEELAANGTVTFPKAPADTAADVAASILRGGFKTRTGAQRYNNRQDKIFDRARKLEKERLARGEKPNPNLTDTAVSQGDMDEMSKRGAASAKDKGPKIADIDVKMDAAKKAVNASALAKVCAGLDKSKPVDLLSVIATLGGVPVYWDDLMAVLKADGYKMPAVKSAGVKASALRQQGMTPAEVKSVLCGAGLSLSAAKSALVTAARILADGPTVQKPTAPPSSGMQWVWVDASKAWEEQPAVSAAKVLAAGEKDDRLSMRVDVSDPMVQGYLVAALWSSNDESTESGGEPFDSNYEITDIDPKSSEQAKADCAAFKEKAGALLEGYGDASQVGHDFWLTRNGHGAGFWDRYLDFDDPAEREKAKETGKKLTEIAKTFGELNPILGDDGKIHFE